MAAREKTHGKGRGKEPEQNFITGEQMGEAHHTEAHEKTHVEQEHDVKQRVGQYNGRGEAPLMKK